MLRQSVGQVLRQYAGYCGKAHLRIRRLPLREGCVRWRRASKAALISKRPAPQREHIQWGCAPHELCWQLRVGGIAGAYREPARSSSIRPCRPRMKIKLRASDSCERGHRHGEWALGSNVKLMAGIGVPVPSVNDGAIADRLDPPSESGRELQPRGFFTGFSPAPICRN